MSNSEIVKQTGIKYPTVWAYAKEIREKTSEGQRNQETGMNEDRHLCQTCKFRGKGQTKQNGIGCEYAVHKGHSRGCSIADCSVYQKGDPEKKTKQIVLP